MTLAATCFANLLAASMTECLGSLLGLLVTGKSILPGVRRVPGGLTEGPRPTTDEGALVISWVAVSCATKISGPA